MKSKNVKWVFTLLVFVMGLAANSLAEILPAFDMRMMADRAQRIVVGNMDRDGLLIVNLVLKSTQADPASKLKTE